VQILNVDKAIPILVDHREGLFELLNLVLAEHGEDIGCGSLRTLLWLLGLS